MATAVVINIDVSKNRGLKVLDFSSRVGTYSFVCVSKKIGCLVSGTHTPHYLVADFCSACSCSFLLMNKKTVVNDIASTLTTRKIRYRRIYSLGLVREWIGIVKLLYEVSIKMYFSSSTAPAERCFR